MTPARPDAETQTVDPFISTDLPASTGPLRLPQSVDLEPRSLLSQIGEPVAPQSRYEICETVGSGGMGDVVRARDRDLNRDVAMKLLRAGKDGSRFLAEAQITSQLEHPNLIPIHDLGVDRDGNLFFTMQYVRTQETVQDVIAALRQGDKATFARYSFKRRVHIIQQVCHALHYAHERGVVHRDIKPANIMLGAHGEVYLLDWGVAKLIDAPKREQPLHAAPGPTIDVEGFVETCDGALIGTPAYMAPEQLLGEIDRIGPGTDVYALSAVAYELLTLRYYMGKGDKLGRVSIHSLIHDAPVDAENHTHPLNGRVPRQLSRLCRKGLLKDPADRFQSAQELEHSLQLWIEGKAPVVCLGTFMQRGLGTFSTWIDRHPVLIPMLTVFLFAFALFCLSTLTTLVLRN